MNIYAGLALLFVILGVIGASSWVCRSEKRGQALVHKFEEGGWAKWIRRAAFLAAILTMSYLWLLGSNGFKGLSHPRAFEQAEIAREIARGNGFSTRIIRPA